MILPVKEFYSQLQTALHKYLSAFELKVNEISPLRLKARVILSQSTFIDVFYGARKDRVDFALIHEGERIFGIDNLHYWHCHQLGNERKHFKIEPMSVEGIVLEIKKNIEKIR
ncbi:MAG TPA: hypothetical protein VJ000_00730 [Thermodesulfovibrionia bacterium]|nr:hypothetical protein [Thermodesulfovibrionia bacterium]